MTDTAGTAIAVLAALGVAGTVFGRTAAVTLSLTRLLRATGPGATLAHWQPWALLGLGTAGLLLFASAFQAGPLAASLPVMDTVEPVSGVLLGTLLFGERLAGSPAGITLLSRYPGTTGAGNAANQAGAAVGLQVPAAASGRNAGHTWAAR